MVIGDRLREMREQKKLSPGDIEKRTGLLRCYISRVENGYTVPAIETLEKMAHAFQVPMYRLFYEGEKPPELPAAAAPGNGEPEWGSTGKEARYLHKFRGYLSKMDKRDRAILLACAQKATKRK